MEQSTVLAEITPELLCCPVQIPAPSLRYFPRLQGAHSTQPGWELSPPSPAHPPAQQPQLAGAVLVHDNSQGQSDGTEQEGANGEGQVQHFILGVAGRPFVL